MNPWLAFTLASLVVSLTGYAGLVVWTWRTSDGMGWVAFRMISVFDLLRTVGWAVLVAANPVRYDHPQFWLAFVVISQACGAIFSCALAFSIRRAFNLKDRAH